MFIPAEAVLDSIYEEANKFTTLSLLINAFPVPFILFEYTCEDVSILKAILTLSMHFVSFEVANVLFSFACLQLSVSLSVALLEHSIVRLARWRFELTPSVIATLVDLPYVFDTVRKGKCSLSLLDVFLVASVIGIAVCIAIQTMPLFLIVVEMSGVSVSVRVGDGACSIELTIMKGPMVVMALDSIENLTQSAFPVRLSLFEVTDVARSGPIREGTCSLEFIIHKETLIYISIGEAETREANLDSFVGHSSFINGSIGIFDSPMNKMTLPE